jgi:hypothetical protein
MVPLGSSFACLFPQVSKDTNGQKNARIAQKPEKKEVQMLHKPGH